MEEPEVINLNSEKPASQDFSTLRRIGLEHIEQISGKIWTDYNLHDPGVTMLESLAFAITDLSNRTSFEIGDLLSEAGQFEVGSNSPATLIDGINPNESGLYEARDVLHNNPVTATDIRKILIDLDGIRNAWVEAANILDNDFSFDVDYSEKLNRDKTGVSKLVAASSSPFAKNIDSLNGLYRIVLEKEVSTTKTDVQLIESATNVLNQYRNFCEDFVEIKMADGEEQVQVLGSLEISSDADANKVLAEVYFRLNRYFSPSINYYSIAQLLDRGKSVNQIFSGPPLVGGFIDDDELGSIERRKVVYVSDLIQEVMDVPGVIGVRKMSVKDFYRMVSASPDIFTAFGTEAEWCLQLVDVATDAGFTKSMVMELKMRSFKESSDPSAISLFRANAPAKIDMAKVSQVFDALILSEAKSRNESRIVDLEYPNGTPVDITDYYAIQNELPEVYGTGLGGINESDSTAERIGQLKQLKGYLLFFEQLLVNYLKQLENAREVYSLNEGDRTYYTQALSGIKDLADLYTNDVDGLAVDYKDAPDGNLISGNLSEAILLDVESSDTYSDRKNRVLEHLIARFNESFVDYSLIMVGLGKEGEVIEDKVNFLRSYPVIGSGRGKAYDRFGLVWDTTEIGGYEERVSRFLGFQDYLSYPSRDVKRQFFAPDYVADPTVSPEIYNVTFKLKSGDYTFDIDGVTGISDAEKIADAKARINSIMSSFGDGELLVKIEGDDSITLRNTSTLLATSSIITSPPSAELVKEELLEYLTHGAGIHAIENILLRPKSASYHFLDIEANLNLDEAFADYNYTRITKEYVKDAIGYNSVPVYNYKIHKSDGSFISLKEVIHVNNSGEGFYRLRSRLETGGSNVGNQYKDLVVYKFDATTELNKDRGINLVERVLSNFKNYNLLDDNNSPPTQYYFDIRERSKVIYEGAKTAFEVRNENILQIIAALYVRTKSNPGNYCASSSDPYSFRATVLLPAWTQKSSNYSFRQYAEKIIRREAPAHVQTDIKWVSATGLRDFEECYKAWLEEIANPTSPSMEVQTTNCVIDAIGNLEDEFSANYVVSAARTLDTYVRPKEGSPPFSPAVYEYELWAYATDPDGKEIVGAQLIEGELPDFAKLIVGDTEDTNYLLREFVEPISDYEDSEVAFINSFSLDAGEIILHEDTSDARNLPLYGDNPVKIGDIIFTGWNTIISGEEPVILIENGEWIVTIRTINEESDVVDHRVKLVINADQEIIVYDVDTAPDSIGTLAIPCYEDNQLLAYLEDPDQSPVGPPVMVMLANNSKNIPKGIALIGRNSVGAYETIIEDGATLSPAILPDVLHIKTSVQDNGTVVYDPQATPTLSPPRGYQAGDLFIYDIDLFRQNNPEGVNTDINVVTSDGTGGFSFDTIVLKINKDALPYIDSYQQQSDMNGMIYYAGQVDVVNPVLQNDGTVSAGILTMHFHEDNLRKVYGDMDVPGNIKIFDLNEPNRFIDQTGIKFYAGQGDPLNNPPTCSETSRPSWLVISDYSGAPEGVDPGVTKVTFSIDTTLLSLGSTVPFTPELHNTTMRITDVCSETDPNAYVDFKFDLVIHRDRNATYKQTSNIRTNGCHAKDSALHVFGEFFDPDKPLKKIEVELMDPFNESLVKNSNFLLWNNSMPGGSQAQINTGLKLKPTADGKVQLALDSTNRFTFKRSIPADLVSVKYYSDDLQEGWISNEGVQATDNSDSYSTISGDPPDREIWKYYTNLPNPNNNPENYTTGYNKKGYQMVLRVKTTDIYDGVTENIIVKLQVLYDIINTLILPNGASILPFKIGDPLVSFSSENEGLEPPKDLLDTYVPVDPPNGGGGNGQPQNSGQPQG